MADSAPKIIGLLKKLDDGRADQGRDEATGVRIECPLCFESYKDALPKVLPCGHTVCGPCLQRSVTDNSLQCPLDRSTVQLPRGGVDGLPTNYSLQGLFSDSNSDSSRQTTPRTSECEECHETTATQLCSHCQQTICLECQKLHADESRAQLRRLAKQLRSTQVATEKELARKLAMITDHKHQFDNAKAKADKFGDDLLKKVSLFVQSQKQLVYTRIDDAAREYEELVATLLGQVHENSTHTTNCKEVLEKLCNSNKLVLFSDAELREFNEFLSSTKAAVDTFRPSSPKCDFLTPDEDVQDNACDQLACLFQVTDLWGVAVDADAETGARSQTDPPATRKAPGIIMKATSTLTFRGEERMEETASSRGAVAIGDNLLVDPHRRRAMRDLDEFTLEGGIPLRNEVEWHILGASTKGMAGYLKGPYASTRSRVTGDIFVADGEANNIEVFKSDGTPKYTIGAKGAIKVEFSCPVSVAWAPLERIFVTDSERHRIQVINLTSSNITTWGRKGTEGGAFNKPYDIAIDESNGDVFVVDKRNSRVQVITKDGRFKNTFASKGNTPGKLSKPTGIAVSRGEVFVANLRQDNVQVIHVYSTKGEYIREVYDNRVMFVYGLAIDSRHTNLLACCASGIAVFTLGRYTMQRIITCPVPATRPLWITLLSATHGLITVKDGNQLYKVELN